MNEIPKKAIILKRRGCDIDCRSIRQSVQARRGNGPGVKGQNIRGGIALKRDERSQRRKNNIVSQFVSEKGEPGARVGILRAQVGFEIESD